MKRDPWPKFNEDFPELDYWMQCRQAERGSNRTLVEYRAEVEHFASWVGGRKAVLSATRRQVRDYLYYMVSERQASPSTQRRALACLRSFFAFLVAEEKVSRNVTDGIPKPYNPFRLPRVLSVRDIQTLASSERIRPEGPRTDVLVARDRAIIALLYSAGLRRAEMKDLVKSQINMKERSITIIGKGNKQRVVYFTEDCREDLAAWFAVRPMTSSEHVFVTTVGEPLSMRHIWHIVKTELASAGLEGSTHTLRHSFASHLYKQGLDLFKIQKLLGHSNPATTELYVHLGEKDLKDGYDSATKKGD